MDNSPEAQVRASGSDDMHAAGPSTSYAGAPEQVRRDLEDGARPIPRSAIDGIEAAIESIGGAWQEGEEYRGSVGRTTFDLPTSQDKRLTVVLPKEHVVGGTIGSQSVVRIKSGTMPQAGSDGLPKRNYIGVVVAGPFAEPDGLRGDAPVIITTAARGGVLTPPYHGRVEVEVMGEEMAGGLVPPRFRPLPNSPVFLLSDIETARIMKVDGDLRLGMVMGYRDIAVKIPRGDKSVLPRHTGILGTTGAGKSTTVSRLIAEAQANGYAVIVIDVEGEYTRIDEPTDDARMLSALRERGLEPGGVPNTTVYHLVGRETANPDHPRPREFCLQFALLSPYAVKEILDLTEAQQIRFDMAYDVAKLVMKELGIFPERGNRDHEQMAVEIDEFERGYPRLTLSLFIDVLNGFLHVVNKQPGEPSFYNGRLHDDEARDAVMRRIRNLRTDSPTSWRALYSKLWQLKRLGVFDVFENRKHDNQPVLPLVYKNLLRPGQVSLFDLSDTDSTALNNLVIADLLRGVQDEQDKLYEAAQKQGDEMPRVLIIIEEAHEFLSSERIEKMPVLFQQVARIAKRGRKRWLSLVFVTQLPQHLPTQVLGLLNNYIIHKITDTAVISKLQRTVPGISESQWDQVAALAPGQAVVSFTHMARPLMVSVDPTPCKLRMVD